MVPGVPPGRLSELLPTGYGLLALMTVLYEHYVNP